jgi:hypothetical protein
VNFGFLTVSIVILLFLFFVPRLAENPVILRLGQILFVLGIIILVLGFRKRKHVGFSDRNRNFITETKITSGNEEQIRKVIELIKSNSKLAHEADPQKPFPDSKPQFELVEYNVPDFMNKSTTRFFEKEFIDSEKSLADEVAFRFRYDELSQQTTRAWVGNSSWTSLGCNLAYISIAIFAFPRIFQVQTSRAAIYTACFFFVLAVIAFLMRFVKEEIICFRNQENRIIHCLKVTRSNKDKVDEILRFLQARRADNSADLDVQLHGKHEEKIKQEESY